MANEPENRPPDGPGITRKELLKRAGGGAALLSVPSLLAACGGGSGGGGSSSGAGGSTSSAKLKTGGHLRVGATGGSAKDVIDAHNAIADTDIVRISTLYEPLAAPTPDFKSTQMVLAESIEPVNGNAALWDIRLRPGIEFTNGQTVTADDVIFSINRIINPKSPGTGAASIGYINTKGMKKMDSRTVRVPLQFANAGFIDDLGQYFNNIVPTNYNPKSPVGTAAWKFQSFTPGQQSVFVKNPNYWQSGRPYADQLTIIDFADDTARVNALLANQIDIADTVPTELLPQVQSNGNALAIDNPAGGWLPITMRVDQPPFNDVRVRQAMRLIVNRPQMVEQVLSGHGDTGNDLYGRFDPSYDTSLPQRHQDIEQAKSLLKAAGHEGLTVTLVTGDILAGVPEESQVFAQQAKAAGVTVNLDKSTTFYGSNYLKYTFAMDFWGPRRYLSQVAQGSLPNSPFNETHWDNAQFKKLIAEARAEVNTSKRYDLIHEAQTIEYNEGGYIIAFFPNFTFGASSKLGGIPPGLQSTFLMGPALKDIGFKA
ncbi:MAG TPA: ABC transporter substrate-binding protein [Solirubrobacteraceae bacterium]|jgi:peptide/nickel transport system substrate-binding protein|nr:ABC transporter substrate-binding protein [Solirubrobacteraceae bacterium]